MQPRRVGTRKRTRRRYDNLSYPSTAYYSLWPCSVCVCVGQCWDSVLRRSSILCAYHSASARLRIHGRERRQLRTFRSNSSCVSMPSSAPGRALKK